MVAEPLWPEAGVTVTVRLPPLPPNSIPLSGTNVVLDELPDTFRLLEADSGSLTARAIGPVVVSSEIVRLEILLIVGASLTGSTVTVKVSLSVRLPSLTVTVIVVVPDWSADGVTVTVRFDPLPPNTMPLTGTSDVFDDEALKVRLPAGLSASPTVNAIDPVVLSSGIVVFEMSLIVGAVFGGGLPAVVASAVLV